ncbi:SRPBCC family protein [Pontibacter actiniarum]|nr:SRPBCC family protein [Pontibacter actiniarum]
MKLFTLSLLSLLLLLAAAIGFPYLLPTQISVQQSIYLQEPPEEVYPYLNNPTQWEHWSVLSKRHDPSIIHLYGGPLEGKGSRLQWSGDRAGNGYIHFTESISPSTITYLQTEKENPAGLQGAFYLNPAAEGTKVTWRQQVGLADTPLARLQGALRKYKMQQEQEQGLLGLKALLESKSKKRASLCPPLPTRTRPHPLQQVWPCSCRASVKNAPPKAARWLGWPVRNARPSAV